MSCGWWEYRIQSSFHMRLYTILFGVSDLHSHIRFRAIKKLFQPKSRNVEVGAGGGIMSIGFYYTAKKPIIAVVYTNEELEHLKNKTKKLKLNHIIKVMQGNAMYIDSCIKRCSAEQVLLIDVLEHVDDDLKALKAINNILVTGGYLVISCPTPYYPCYFGIEFDNAIGHLRHYTLKDLKTLLDRSGFKVLDYYYYTSSTSSLLCMIYYARIRRYLYRALIMPLLNILSFIFEKKNKHCKGHSSLAILAVKSEDVL
jgi:ubiquinone/menaquinone biosynthesis C-methylase UbiE